MTVARAWRHENMQALRFREKFIKVSGGECCEMQMNREWCMPGMRKRNWTATTQGAVCMKKGDNMIQTQQSG